MIGISDRIYVLKDGEVVHEFASGEASPPVIHMLMVGRSAAQSRYREGEHGLDVGAKEDVYDPIRQICAQGAGVLLIAAILAVGAFDRALLSSRV